MDGQKITLDKSSLTALASETRIAILKNLDSRPMTTSELSRALARSKPTIIQHLDKLGDANLVHKREQGKKWIYYRLTQKAKHILHPERVKIYLTLSLAVASAVGALTTLWMYLTRWTSEGASRLQSESQPSDYSNYLVSEHYDKTFLYLSLALLVVFGVSLIVTWLYWRRDAIRYAEY